MLNTTHSCSAKHTGQVIVAEPISGSPGVASRWEVIAAHLNPSFIGGDVPKLVPIDERNEEIEFEFTEYVSYDEGEDFDNALQTLRSGHYETAAQLNPSRCRQAPVVGRKMQKSPGGAAHEEQRHA